MGRYGRGSGGGPFVPSIEGFLYLEYAGEKQGQSGRELGRIKKGIANGQEGAIQT